MVREGAAPGAAEVLHVAVRVRPVVTGVGGAALAAGVSFFASPHEGARRRRALRALALDARRWLAARGARLVAVARTTLGPPPVSDELLADRVRVRLMRLGAGAAGVSVTAREGAVVLRGVLPSSEHRAVLDAAARVGGVRRIYDLLDTPTEARPWVAHDGGTPGERPP